MLSTYGSSGPLACPLTCPELFRHAMALPSVVVSPKAACLKVDANDSHDAGCHGSVSHCIAGVLVKGHVCCMLF
jgi:hypothetical protein